MRDIIEEEKENQCLYMISAGHMEMELWWRNFLHNDTDERTAGFYSLHLSTNTLWNLADQCEQPDN